MCRVNWIFVLKFIRAMRASVSVSAIELTCDVTIAVHAVSRSTDLRVCCCPFIQSVSIGLLIAPGVSVPMLGAGWPGSRACRAELALSIHRPGPFIDKSIRCSVVLHAFASFLYFRVSFCVWVFLQRIKVFHCRCRLGLTWSSSRWGSSMMWRLAYRPLLFLFRIIKLRRVNWCLQRKSTV